MGKISKINFKKLLTKGDRCDIICKVICFTVRFIGSKVVFMYQKDMNMSYLLDFYGEAIPDKHREILSQYYEEDLSLSEIAGNFDISRQGARHLIKKGEEQLLFLEDKLGLARRYRDTSRLYDEFGSLMERFGDELRRIENNDRLLELFDKLLQISQKMKLD